MIVPLWAWLAVLSFIVLMLALDLFAHRRAHVIGVREAALWSAVWVAFGVGSGILVWQVYGAEFGQQYFAGYLIEKSLAVDNVFIWAIIFTYFAVPREYQHRVLFFGVLGALVFRGIFIAAGSAIIASAGWVLYFFAAFLLVTGYRMLRQRNSHLDPEKSRALRLFRKHVPMTDDFHGQRFLVRRWGLYWRRRCSRSWSSWKRRTSTPAASRAGAATLRDRVPGGYRRPGTTVASSRDWFRIGFSRSSETAWGG